MADLVNMADQFKGLPMKDLIGGPLTAVCEAQENLAKSTEQYIREIGLQEIKQEGDAPPLLKTRQVDFHFHKPMPSPDGTSIAQAQVDISVPLLALVPVPALLIQDVEIEFNMEVKSSATSKSSTDVGADVTASVGFGPFSASMHGSVASHNEQTRASDNSARYHVKISAKQAETPEGLSRVLDMLRDTISPKNITSTEETHQISATPEIS